MDLDALRTVIAVADSGQFQEAAVELSVTQQAVSKRVAALEAELGVRLFTRRARGAVLTIDGQAFLPHARTVLAAAERAAESVRPGRRALRVDVIGRRAAPGELLHDFHRANPDLELDVVALPVEAAAVDAVRDGVIDATFRAPMTRLPDGLASTRVLNDPLDLLTGPAHHLAAASSVRLEELAGQRIWLPGVVDGTEWAAYYAELGVEFGLHIDRTGPNFGFEHILDMVAESATLCTFVGHRTRVAWTMRHDLRRVPVTDPVPVYPHTVVWRTDNPHPGLAALIAHLGSVPAAVPGTWVPGWARR
ncbi:LysR family transcriptional regulator [Actinophytocola glycyrrhizae]|uniref:LysR family transcriptional regulator n=1 Tax=Actinophytocola glycyrrhizae TaxID=2044873 RepID=A0ABV9RUU5_9PSEU